MKERLARSTPEALHFEPGVYVQQTAHGQGSAYIRGRTGQQTVLLFDGIRLNNSTFRQGPNQYFFTIDARTIRSIEVLRGGASTRFGSDAIGGAINAHPLRPTLDPTQQRIFIEPLASLRVGSADGEIGGRAQVEIRPMRELALLGGVGYRRAGRLTGGGVLRAPATGAPADVPRYEDDRATQLGTGFKELASDLRLRFRFAQRWALTAAFYDYRQFDAPRTDLCPAPEAPKNACLMIEEQFRTLAFVRLEHRDPDAVLLSAATITIAFQNQHERRSNRRPASFTENGSRDDVYTLGVIARGRSPEFTLSSGSRLRLTLGADFYTDWIDSKAWTQFTDGNLIIAASRGQYLDDSSYTWGALFAAGEMSLFDVMIFRAGLRATYTEVHAPQDVESLSSAVGRSFFNVVGRFGVELRFGPVFSLITNVDLSFRAPNLDDLTSRQQTGPGFQFENAALGAESALSTEIGARLDLHWLQLEFWGYAARLDGAIERAPRDVGDCPPDTPQCGSSWNRFQLINLGAGAMVRGVEGFVRVYLPARLTARATLAYAWGQGANPSNAPTSPGAELPLSRIPPLNGTLELRWRRGPLTLGAGLRWALSQDRLSLGDQSDARIPDGGTPGYATFDLRAGYRWRRKIAVNLLFENVGDAVYRYHGSSVNGAGRSVTVNVEARY